MSSILRAHVLNFFFGLQFLRAHVHFQNAHVFRYVHKMHMKIEDMRAHTTLNAHGVRVSECARACLRFSQNARI